MGQTAGGHLIFETLTPPIQFVQLFIGRRSRQRSPGARRGRFVFLCYLEVLAVRRSFAILPLQNKTTRRMKPPSLYDSTADERREYVKQAWACMHHCELCGKCHILRGRDPETLYADYIDGRRDYLDITLELRHR